jgi:hypothetical protein
MTHAWHFGCAVLIQLVCLCYTLKCTGQLKSGGICSGDFPILDMTASFSLTLMHSLDATQKYAAQKLILMIF